MREIGHFIGGKQVAGHVGPLRRRLPADDRRGAAPASRSPRKAEVRAAVENAKAAQPGWAATNPQRRARVLMKFLELVANATTTSSPNCSPASTARPSPTPRATSSAASRWSSSPAASRI